MAIAISGYLITLFWVLCKFLLIRCILIQFKKLWISIGVLFYVLDCSCSTSWIGENFNTHSLYI